MFYSRLKAAYGSKYKFSFPSDADEQINKREWAVEIIKLTPADIDRGITKAKLSAASGDNRFDWPNVPAVIGLCRATPEDCGLSSIADAWHEAASNSGRVHEHNWSHDAVRQAGQMTGWFDLCRACDEFRLKGMKDRFTKNYLALVNQVMNGQELTSGLLENDKDKALAEQAEAYNRQKLKKTMTAQGINPDGGRAEFMKIRGML